jgi:hypothetical protein
MATIDFGLRLNPRAWSVLHLLAVTSLCDGEPGPGFDPDLRTYPWYNGRERGFLLFLRRTPVEMKGLYVAFAEERCSDRIFVECWEGELGTNPPTVFELRDPAIGEAVYRNRKAFALVDEAADYIRQRLELYCKVEVEPERLPEEEDD